MEVCRYASGINSPYNLAVDMTTHPSSKDVGVIRFSTSFGGEENAS